MAYSKSLCSPGYRQFSIVAFAALAPATFGYYLDIFVRDRTTGITEQASVNSQGQPGNDGCEFPDISSDGTIVAFASFASNLVANDTNDMNDIFVRDRTKGVTAIVSISSSGVSSNAGSSESAISADGNLVVFQSYASNLIASDTNQRADIFIRDRSKKTTHRLSTSTSGAQADADCYSPAISADGTIVAFASAATTLVSGDTNSVSDIFIRDRNAATTERVSIDSSGAEGNGDSYEPALSSDGRFVVFRSNSSNLDPRDTDSKSNVFLHDQVTKTTTLLTINEALAPTDGDSYSSAISDDGGVIAFESKATNLILGDTNFVADVFADDLTVPPLLASWSNYGSGYPGTLGVPTLTASVDPVFGTTISIDASNSSGNWSEGFVPVGVSPADVPTSAGGELLVTPLSLLLLPLLPSGGSIVTAIPRDLNFHGLTLYLQVIEIDPGAQHGLSFTPGLQLTLGQ